MLDMPRVREVFEASTDFTVGIEEEFAILDPGTLSLDQRFEELRERQEDPVLAESRGGWLIRSEIEIRSGRGETFSDAVARPARGAFAAVRARGRERRPARRHRHTPVEPVAGQKIIDTEHYQAGPGAAPSTSHGGTTRSASTSTWASAGLSARCVCATACAPVMPELLAISANSPFLDGRHSGLHSARTQIFTKSFPRCGIPDSFGELERPTPTTSTSFVRTHWIAEFTQVWWSVRPHRCYGTVEMRICDAQASGDDSTTLAALIVLVR